MKQSVAALAIASLALVPVCGWAANYKEATDGALSNNYQSPTLVSITEGSNSIAGTLGTAGQDYDFARIKIPSGFAMTSLKWESLTNDGGGTFFAISRGKVNPIMPYGSTGVGLLGWITISPANLGPKNLLSILGEANRGGFGNTGFTGPLKADDYTFWVQDYNYNVTYKFSFFIEKAVAPVVSVTTQKVINKKVAIKVKASGSATTMSYRVGTKGAFKKVSGGSPWAFSASHLKVGKNVVILKATGDFGTSTKRLSVVVK